MFLLESSFLRGQKKTCLASVGFSTHWDKPYSLYGNLEQALWWSKIVVLEFWNFWLCPKYWSKSKKHLTNPIWSGVWGTLGPLAVFVCTQNIQNFEDSALVTFSKIYQASFAPFMYFCSPNEGWKNTFKMSYVRVTVLPLAITISLDWHYGFSWDFRESYNFC